VVETAVKLMAHRRWRKTPADLSAVVRREWMLARPREMARARPVRPPPRRSWREFRHLMIDRSRTCGQRGATLRK
jgi:hypothetical protein